MREKRSTDREEVVLYPQTEERSLEPHWWDWLPYTTFVTIHWRVSYIEGEPRKSCERKPWVDGTKSLRVRCTSSVYTHKIRCQGQSGSQLSVVVNGLYTHFSEVYEGQDFETQKVGFGNCHSSSLFFRDDPDRLKNWVFLTSPIIY